MMYTKNDPLVQSVQKIMQENQLRRDVEAKYNKDIGVQSKRQLPHEKHKAYDDGLANALKKALTEGVVSAETYVISEDVLPNLKPGVSGLSGQRTTTDANGVKKNISNAESDSRASSIVKNTVQGNYRETSSAVQKPLNTNAPVQADAGKRDMGKYIAGVNSRIKSVAVRPSNPPAPFRQATAAAPPVPAARPADARSPNPESPLARRPVAGPNQVNPAALQNRGISPAVNTQAARPVAPRPANPESPLARRPVAGPNQVNPAQLQNRGAAPAVAGQTAARSLQRPVGASMVPAGTKPAATNANAPIPRQKPARPSSDATAKAKAVVAKNDVRSDASVGAKPAAAAKPSNLGAAMKAAAARGEKTVEFGGKKYAVAFKDKAYQKRLEKKAVRRKAGAVARKGQSISEAVKKIHEVIRLREATVDDTKKTDNKVLMKRKKTTSITVNPEKPEMTGF